jgi:HEAT repeat protein
MRTRYQHLFKRIKEGDQDERDAAYDAVLFDRAEAIPDLRECYEESEKEPLMRFYSVQLLGFSGDRRAIPAVTAALDDPSPAVRAEACRSLEDLGAKKSLPALRARLNDLEPEVRLAANEAVEALRG